jgi:hypothetical protein
LEKPFVVRLSAKVHTFQRAMRDAETERLRAPGSRLGRSNRCGRSGPVGAGGAPTGAGTAIPFYPIAANASGNAVVSRRDG